jgi:hypothetical protein
MSKKIKLILLSAVAVVVLVGVGLGTYFGVLYVNPEEFINELDTSGVFKNSFENRIAQTDIFDVMYDHMIDNTSGKQPKLLFVGYDGAIANAIPLQKDYQTSAIFKLRETGGVYLGYCGGAKPGDQDTSTAPGWAAAFTGVWGSVSGVEANKNELKETSRSIIYQFGERGIPTSYSVTWEPHIERTYVKEVTSAETNSYPIDYVLGEKDEDTFLDMKERIESGDTDAIFGILEYTDSAGHGFGYKTSIEKYMDAVRNAEDDAYSLISTIESRATYAEEDWLIIIMSDHGGIYRNHGKTSYMESTIFFASNKEIFG